MGQHIRRFTWILLLSVTPIALAGKAKSGNLKFELYRDYLILVEASSSGHDHLHFLVDTGADRTIVDRRSAQQLKLHPVAAGKIMDLNGDAFAENALLPDLEGGDMQWRNVTVLIADLSFLEKSLSLRIDGMIGIDILRQSPFTIDYERKEITFSEVSPLDFSAPLHVSQHFLTVEMVINGERHEILLDTGASSLMLFATQFEGVPGSLPGSVVKHSTSLAGAFERRQTQVKDLTLGDAHMGEKAGFVVANQKRAAADFDGLLNPVSVGITRIGIDARRQFISFDLDSAASHAQKHRKEGTAQAETHTLPFHSARNGHILIDVMVNKQQLTMLLDTGSPYTVVSLQTAGIPDKLPSSFESTATGSKLHIYDATGTVTIGGDTFEIGLVATNVERLSKDIGQRCDGIIGQNVLRKFHSVSIDYGSKTVTFTR